MLLLLYLYLGERINDDYRAWLENQETWRSLLMDIRTHCVLSGVSAGGCCSVPEDWLLDNVSLSVLRMFLRGSGSDSTFDFSLWVELSSGSTWVGWLKALLSAPLVLIMLSCWAEVSCVLSCWDDLGYLCLDVSLMSVHQNDLLVWCFTACLWSKVGSVLQFGPDDVRILEQMKCWSDLWLSAQPKSEDWCWCVLLSSCWE